MVGVLGVGVLLVVLGVAVLYATKHLLPRIALGEDYRTVVRFLIAVSAGMTITFGLVLVLLGVIAG